MIRIILNDLWLDIKKNFLNFLIYFFVYYIGTAVLVQFTLLQYLGDMIRPDGTYPQAALDDFISADSTGIILLSAASLTTIVLLWLMLGRMPIRLSRPMYVCAAGEKEKMHYLRLHLLIKVMLSMVFTYVLLRFFLVGQFFVSYNWMEVFVQLCLWFFLLIVLNLRTDPGNRKEALKAEPDMVSEKSREVIAGVYWFALLILENIVFYSLAAARVRWTWWIFLAWCIVLAVNLLLARYCINPVLSYMLSYEKIYYPLPDKKE